MSYHTKQLQQTFQTLLNILLPKRQDVSTIQSLQPDDFTQIAYLKIGSTQRALLPFTDERVRACIHEVKYHKNMHAVALLSGVLSQHLSSFSHVDELCIVPVPLSSKRLCERGYNQVTLIAQQAAEYAGARCHEDLLIRIRDTQPQTTLTRAERLQNLRDAFALKDETIARETLRDMHVIVLDDVVTTGATLTAARAALAPLEPHVASLSYLALAH